MAERNIRRKIRLGDLLVEQNVIDEDKLVLALKKQRENGKKLGEIFIDMGFTTEEAIAEALHMQLGIPRVNLFEKKIEENVLAVVKENDVLLRKHLLIPYEFKEDNANILRVAMSDPMDIIAIDDIAIVTNMQIEIAVSTPREVSATLDRYFGNTEAKAVADRYTQERQDRDIVTDEEEVSNEEVENSPIVLLVKKIIEQAVRQRASDIHIEPLENELRIRYRVDGILKESIRYDSKLLTAIVARIKITGGMDISEKRKPQDGRITMIVDRQEYDIRVSILPTVFGEKVVMRLTSKINLTRDKKDLGINDVDMVKFDKLLRKPHGIILVTGPTGSGKSTTLYTVLSELNKDEVNIITIEDPVEANLDGINQVQVNQKADLTFAAALRSILRQDPDIIMIGEIRDAETAKIAVKASITGHLVVSTLHTNSAASTISRLIDMGVEPYLIADATVGVIAQRLVRRLCPNCKKEKEMDVMERELLGIKENRVLPIYEAGKCHKCNDTGYQGRIGIYEIMPITSKMKEVIANKGTADQIRNIALGEGMSTLRMSASKYVLDGITSVSELKRILFD